MGLKYFIYFLLGGTITSTVTYFANNSRGLFAAFIGTLPAITISTFLIIYFNAGEAAVIAYAKGLAIMILPWLIFIVSVVFLAPRMNFIFSLLVSLVLQVVIAFFILTKLGGLSFKP
ncbi:MAG TPA: hypothetical protein VEE82_03980 [Thermodesulfovibrionales bacterium]|nr:hypothetical protein [Thermodesulfovibrionales bacterium]